MNSLLMEYMTIKTSPLPHWFIPIFENEAVAGGVYSE
jgi:hypothetical protein